MIIPISNSLYKNFIQNENYLNIDLNKLNKLELKKVDKKKFKSIKILDLIPDDDSLFETVIVAANDELVNLFLNNKIKFDDIYKILLQIAHPFISKV